MDYENTYDIDRILDNDTQENVESSTSAARRKTVEEPEEEPSVKKIRVNISNPADPKKNLVMFGSILRK